MASHRLGGAQDGGVQRGGVLLHGALPGQDDLFGVKVRVQGIKGQPYVVLNSSGREKHKDVSVITHQAGYAPGVARRSEDGEPPPFHYQQHPEILRPYDPDGNNLHLVGPGQVSARPPSQTTSSAAAAKPRIPLPAQGTDVDGAEETPNKTCPSGAPAAPPDSVDSDSIMSVGRLISQFNSSLRRGRGPRGRLDPEACRRSRSMDNRRTSDSSPSPSSHRASSLRGAKGDHPGGMYPPGSARARLLGGEPPLTSGEVNGRSSTLPRGPGGKGTVSHPAAKVSHGADTGSEEREAQVTPDLLKGRQELSVDPPEDTAKQILITYLQDGTTDDVSTTERKANLLLSSMRKMKWTTAAGGEENDCRTEVERLQEKQDSLETQVSQLKQKLQIEIKNEMTLAKAFEKARTERKKVQEELSKSQAELLKLRDRLAETEAELQSTRQELTQMKNDKERSKAEMKDLQQQLSEMHDELDRASTAEVISAEKGVLLQDLAQLRLDFQDMLQVKEEQEEVLQHTEKELRALKGDLKDEVETHDKYIAALKDEYEVQLEKLWGDLESAKASHAQLGQEKAGVEEEKGAAQLQLQELLQDRDQLKATVRELGGQADHLSQTIQECKSSERQLEQRAKQLEREKQQVEEMLRDVRRNEEDMSLSNQSLLSRLEDVQGKLTKLNHEHRDLKEKLKEERKQIEELWKTRTELEDERRLQDRAMEQLQRKMNNIVEECEASTDVLQSQVDEAKQRSQREVAELRRQLQEKGAELEKSRQAARRLQEELLPLEEDLQRCHGEQQEAELRARQLEQRVEDLEERNATALEERERHVKLLEGRVSRLEEDLNEERGSADRLMERLDKTKEQMDQMRTELLQERAISQDLECDKTSLERQNKDLRGRVAHLEGSQRNGQDSHISKLNSRIQELEERLQGEERDNNNLQQVNRKLERKVKEMRMQADEEHTNLQTHTDQLTQRLKTAKRQMDEAEEEIERLEHAKKKLQRDLDEQMEVNEQLHGQLSALRNDMRRKKKSAAIIKVVEENVNNMDDFGSD